MALLNVASLVLALSAPAPESPAPSAAPANHGVA